jgi:hypothetical protein
LLVNLRKASIRKEIKTLDKVKPQEPPYIQTMFKIGFLYLEIESYQNAKTIFQKISNDQRLPLDALIDKVIVNVIDSSSNNQLLQQVREQGCHFGYYIEFNSPLNNNIVKITVDDNHFVLDVIEQRYSILPGAATEKLGFLMENIGIPYSVKFSLIKESKPLLAFGVNAGGKNLF